MIELKKKKLISELYYVIALHGGKKQLAEVYAAIQDAFLKTEIEMHKVYSRSQINIYVKASIKSCFDIFMKNFPAINVIKLKEPTSFLTHSRQLAPLKPGLEQFFIEQEIVFHDPHTSVIANHCEKQLTRKEEIRAALLALVDQVMLSSTTARMADALGADAIIELGLGNKSVKMLRDNDILTPVFPFTGDSLEELRFQIQVSAIVTALEW